MTPFAIIVSWNGPTAAVGEALDLLRPLRSRCSDGTTSVAVPGAAVAVGLRAVVPAEGLTAGLIVDSDRRRLIVGDVRLYGREALLGRLGGGTLDESDLTLVARTVERFGQNAPEHLTGDFAFVVWDWASRKLWAARDHFGVRGLHYRRLAGGIAFATDVRQLLLLNRPGSPTDCDVDAEMVLNYLLNKRGHRARTYFRAIRQVRPAHRLVANDGRFQELRYWSPRNEPNQSSRYEDYLDEFRTLFQSAVRDRLYSAYPIAAHLSGGLDSGSIVGMAHHLYETGAVENRNWFTMLSAVFPGLECDETSYIDAVLKRTPRFESVRWNGCVADATDLDAPSILSPGLAAGPPTGPRGDLEAAIERGTRVLLIGEGGDEVGRSWGVFQELFRHGRLGKLSRELVAMGSWPRRWWGLREGLRGLVPWSIADAVRDRAWVRGPEPDWLGPELTGIFPGTPDVQEVERHSFTSQVQRDLWRIFSSPRAYSAFDVLLPVAADAGVEVRFPFLDIRLVELALAIPWRFRLPHGDMRRLERDALRPFLAPVVANRMIKPVFGAAIYNQIRLSSSRIREIIHGSVWVSAPFVRQRGAQRLLDECVGRDPEISHWPGWRQVWKIAALETWLRVVFAYSGTGATRVDTPQLGDVIVESAGGSSASPGKLAYEPPVLSQLGSVRELLAGAAGSQDDTLGGFQPTA
jgi:asparagine synthase (glutamine-hydrolysing)